MIPDIKSMKYRKVRQRCIWTKPKFISCLLSGFSIVYSLIQYHDLGCFFDSYMGLPLPSVQSGLFLFLYPSHPLLLFPKLECYYRLVSGLLLFCTSPTLPALQTRLMFLVSDSGHTALQDYNFLVSLCLTEYINTDSPDWHTGPSAMHEPSFQDSPPLLPFSNVYGIMWEHSNERYCMSLKK